MSQENPYSGREAVMFDFACDAQDRGEYFLYVKIPGNIGPVERGDRFEDPLADKLSELGVGSVCGGGSQLGEGKTIEYCGIDVILTKREEGLSAILTTLRTLRAKRGQAADIDINHFVRPEVLLLAEPISGLVPSLGSA